MANPIDKRGKLDEEPFSYRLTKDNRVFISWNGQQVTVLSGSKAKSFINSILVASGKKAQLIMAKATGNFKRGNEKISKKP